MGGVQDERSKRIAVVAETIATVSGELVEAVAEHRRLADIAETTRRDAAAARGRVTDAQTKLTEAQGELKRLADESLR